MSNLNMTTDVDMKNPEKKVIRQNGLVWFSSENNQSSEVWSFQLSDGICYPSKMQKPPSQSVWRRAAVLGWWLYDTQKKVQALCPHTSSDFSFSSEGGKNVVYFLVSYCFYRIMSTLIYVTVRTSLKINCVLEGNFYRAGRSGKPLLLYVCPWEMSPRLLETKGVGEMHNNTLHWTDSSN